MKLLARGRALSRILKRMAAAATLILRDERAKYPDVVLRFENEFAAYIGCKFGVTFCNGTSSLEAALFGINVEAGDRVLVPAFTFHASISPILNAGAQPVFVDVDPNTCNIDLADFERKADSSTRAAIVTHLWGRPINMDVVMDIATSRGIKVIEDCSHAHGAAWKDHKVGSFGAAGCFSLQAAKAVSAGEGGVAVTDDRLVWERMALYGHFDRIQSITDWDHHHLYGRAGVGHKLRAHPVAIALASVDLKSLDADNERKRKLARSARNRLGSIPGANVLFVEGDAMFGGFYEGLPVVLDRGPAKVVAKRLSSLGIPSVTCNYRAWHLDSFMSDPDYRRRLENSTQTFEADQRSPINQEDSCPQTTILLNRLLLIRLDETALTHRMDIVAKTLEDWSNGSDF
jgi:dTDP-4-amino-4,6-dideoxygalactose transaminase